MSGQSLQPCLGLEGMWWTAPDDRQMSLKNSSRFISFIQKNRPQYSEELQAIRDSGTWEKGLVFLLRDVSELSHQATETACKTRTLRETHRRTIAEKLGRAAGKGLLLLESLYENPIVAVNEVEEPAGTSYQAASGRVARMVKCGILMELTRARRLPALPGLRRFPGFLV